MIEKLTKEQKALLPVYRDKWLAIGLSTEPANREAAERGLTEAYRVAGLTKPTFVWCLSPLSARYTILNFNEISGGHSVRESVRESVWDSVRDSVRDSVWDSVWDSVRDSVRDSVWDSVWDSVRNSVGDSVRESVRDSVIESVRDSVGESVRDSVWDSVGESGFGQYDTDWLGFYDYFKNVLRLERQTELLNGLLIEAQNAGWYMPYSNICWISERHNVCKLKEGKIHCETGPAIAYPDGFSVYGLNGVRVPEYLVMTPSNKLIPEQCLKEENAEVRREFVRKFGIERLKNYGERKDKQGLYELIDMANLMVSGTYAPYLLMLNPSIGTYHMEGVHPDCKTVDDALNWRNQTQERPTVLT